ncbi:MAG: hypothetical protein IT168_24455 [Bryobacterales bacterium]|nr:hypothetical protein [Bryobacterales bacterium]
MLAVQGPLRRANTARPGPLRAVRLEVVIATGSSDGNSQLGSAKEVC